MHVALAGSTKKCFTSVVIFLALVSMLFPNVPTKLISVGPPVDEHEASLMNSHSVENCLLGD